MCVRTAVRQSEIVKTSNKEQRLVKWLQQTSTRRLGISLSHSHSHSQIQRATENYHLLRSSHIDWMYGRQLFGVCIGIVSDTTAMQTIHSIWWHFFFLYLFLSLFLSHHFHFNLIWHCVCMYENVNMKQKHINVNFVMFRREQKQQTKHSTQKETKNNNKISYQMNTHKPNVYNNVTENHLAVDVRARKSVLTSQRR